MTSDIKIEFYFKIMLSETTSSSLRRIKLLNNIINSTNNSIKFVNKRNYTDVKNTESGENHC